MTTKTRDIAKPAPNITLHAYAMVRWSPQSWKLMEKKAAMKLIGRNTIVTTVNASTICPFRGTSA